MHDQPWQDIQDTNQEMSDPEKPELIERVVRSMRGRNGKTAVRSPEQVARRIAEIGALPVQSPRNGFSARDHDTVLDSRPNRFSGPKRASS